MVEPAVTADTTPRTAADAAPATPRESAVDVAHLTHRYPGSAPPQPAALDDVSLRVAPGEIFGVLGPNGGGKTTLFRILATLLTPVSQAPGARARIFGHDVRAEPARVRRALGVVFQQPSLDPKLTARENLAHQGRLYGLPRRELRARIDHWLERFNLTDRAEERTERFSGGMRRRVELAKAMLHEPQLLLMDEPATGLDPGARRDLAEQLETLRRDRGVTVALTTHLMDEAERCDRLAILAGGRIVALDAPDRLKQRVGGDVITVEPADASPKALLGTITERFGPWQPHAQPQVVDGCVRFEKPDGAALVSAIANALPGRTRRITVGQPTLEDVFLDLTGSAFHAADR